MQKCFLPLLVLGLALSANAQSNYGVVRGTVTDPQHLPMVGAALQMKAVSTGATRHLVTNQQGIFEASALLPDDYVLTTEAPGFAPQTQSVRLEVGQELAVAVSLTVNPVKQGILVTGANEVRQCAPPLFAWIKLPGKLHVLQEPDQRAGFSFADG